jgi:molybdopterin-guanine dinucleotide biosynthesis protein A
MDYHGIPQARWAFELLGHRCARVFVSVRRDQVGAPAYAALPLVVDGAEDVGPATGLLAALRLEPAAAWLMVAADMPLLDEVALDTLIAGRDTAAHATAYRNADGLPEPLCAIWEPAVLAALENRTETPMSLRRLLERGPSQFLEIADAAVLRSVNTPADDAAVRARLGKSRSAF